MKQSWIRTYDFCDIELIETDVRRIEPEQLFPRQVREIEIERGNKIVGKDTNFSLTFSGPPSVVTGYAVVHGQDLNHVALAKLQFILTLCVVLVNGHPHLEQNQDRSRQVSIFGTTSINQSPAILSFQNQNVVKKI